MRLGPIVDPSQLSPLFQMYIRNPESISHMLFVGPPGSGKTTTALSFAAALHGSECNKFASILFLNSSDERSLETMRMKVYPFVESRIQSIFFTGGKQPPKFVIFDEAETLTDQAQCALRPLLQRPTSEVIVIFICNSLSHIHPNIISKFMCIPFPPIERQRIPTILDKKAPPQLDLILRRGDLRYFKNEKNHSLITEFIYTLLHTTDFHEASSFFLMPGVPFRERVSWFLLFLQGAGFLKDINIQAWSDLSSSEIQSYLQDKQYTSLLESIWLQTMTSLLKIEHPL